jgi:hypothetical protein
VAQDGGLGGLMRSWATYRVAPVPAGHRVALTQLVANRSKKSVQPGGHFLSGRRRSLPPFFSAIHANGRAIRASRCPGDGSPGLRQAIDRPPFSATCLDSRFIFLN